MHLDATPPREDPTVPIPDTLPVVRALVDSIERGDVARARALLDELTRIRETDLFHELSLITDQLHATLVKIQDDTEVSAVVSKNMPDARERLAYVMSKTEEVAHRTLGALEEALPSVKRVGDRASHMHEQWTRFRHREMDVVEFRALARDMDAFLAGLAACAGDIGERLSEVLLAQEYQDLTGQIIRRVIELVQEVDDALGQVVRTSATRAAPAAEPTRGDGSSIDPSAPDVVSGQGDVDDLLSSMGM